jgi:hypothetical protein
VRKKQKKRGEGISTRQHFSSHLLPSSFAHSCEQHNISVGIIKEIISISTHLSAQEAKESERASEREEKEKKV